MVRKVTHAEQHETPELATLPGQISKIEAQQRRTSRVNIFVDDLFSFACRAEVARELGLRVGSELTASMRDAALSEDALHSAYEAAIELLAYRARSEREIASRLKQRKFDAQAVERVLAKLREQGYLDDRDFARFWIENRTANRPRGERALRQELRGKGLDNQIVDDALADADLDQHAMAIEAAEKKIRSLSGLAPEVRRRRLTGYLQRRGFGWDAIKPALERVLEPDEMEEMEEEIP